MWSIGERVLGGKGGEQHLYCGTVRHIDGDRCYVIFDDGDDALLEATKLRKLALRRGSRVHARLPMEKEFTPAEVLAWDDDKVHVRWDHGDDNWVSWGMLRLQTEGEGEPRPSERKRLFAQGDRVFGCWHDLNWYPGIVLAVNGDQFHVLLDDGNQTMLAGDRLRPLQLEAGERVSCRWKGRPEYFPGEVTRRSGELLHVAYDDGDEETTSIRLVRLQRDEWFPPAELGHIRPGDRVLGCWYDAHWYPGVVLFIEAKRVHVLFDDGDQALLTPDRLRALDIKEGDRLACRKKGGPAYYPGEVTKKQGEVIRVVYDDGDEETTSIRLIRLTGGGPDGDNRYQT